MCVYMTQLGEIIELLVNTLIADFQRLVPSYLQALDTRIHVIDTTREIEILARALIHMPWWEDCQKPLAR